MGMARASGPGSPRSIMPHGAAESLFGGMPGFVRKDSFLGVPASWPFGPTVFLDTRFLGCLALSLAGFQFVQEQRPGEGAVASLISGVLAFDLDSGWFVQKHDTSRQFVHILPAVSS